MALKCYFKKKVMVRDIEGINFTKTDFFCIINADGSMNPVYLNKMLNNIKIKI